VAGMQHVPCLDLKCGSYTAAAQPRIDAERLDDAVPERRAVVSYAGGETLCMEAGLRAGERYLSRRAAAGAGCPAGLPGR
jgi:hypothetical protein